MSYNITAWRTIRLDGLSIPVDGAFRKEAYEWGKDNALTIRLCEDKGLSGVYADGWLQVERINLRGEGSGWGWEALKAALVRSIGYLDAVLIWEGGDSITRVTSVNGSITSVAVDLVKLLKESDKVKI